MVSLFFCHLYFDDRKSKILIELLRKQQENYLAPAPIEIPYYLCIRTSMHTHDVPSLRARQFKKRGENLPDNVYGKQKLDCEYWFSVPKEK